MHGPHATRRNAWLGLTPEPERELPHAVARLRSRPPEAERRRVERLVLHGSRRGWLRYLGEVTALVTHVAAGDPVRNGPPGSEGSEGAVGGVGAMGAADVEAALVAGEVVLGHHQMLIGLPGPGYDEAAADRALLTRAVERLRHRQAALRAAHDPEAGTR
ncbi:hypothetical protein ABH931_003716 [Streptacidiphilus sp. MAP12-33]|uniref:hypothetical protein n=1 Tax=Streptacidiphilus sp. MAP12-33 TaxID=3156266 RepID=UPI003513DA99